MGCLVSKEEKTANERSRQIDNDLKREAYNEARSVKILLLGFASFYHYSLLIFILHEE